MAQQTLCNYDQFSLEKAPYLFFDSLEAVLAPSENQCGITNGWRAIAALPELAITAEKVQEVEASGTPVASFLRYLVFKHPEKDRWTVRWMEEVARKIRNLRIVKEFKDVKKQLANVEVIVSAEDMHISEPLEIFDMLPYRIASLCARCPIVPCLLLAFFILQGCLSFWLTITESEKGFLSPSTEHIKFWLLLIERLWVRAISPFLFTYRLLVHHLTTVPGDIKNHKLLRILKGHPEHLLALHKEISLPGESAMLEQQNIDGDKVVRHTIKTLYCPLKWLIYAGAVNSVFLPVLLYISGGLSYEHLSQDNNNLTVSLSVWEGISLFSTLMIVSYVYAIFVYEHRLMKYANTVANKISNMEGIAEDCRKLIAKRWHWLSNYTVVTTLLIVVEIGIHWKIDAPLTIRCLTFHEDFSPTKWLYCIVFLTVTSLFTFLNVENTLRPVKRAICFICVLISLHFLYSSAVENFVGTKGLHLHLLLYLIPMIIVFWILWTITGSHCMTVLRQRAEGKFNIRSHVRIILDASCIVITVIAIVISTHSEYTFVHNWNQRPNCSDVNGYRGQVVPLKSSLERDCSMLQSRSQLNIEFPETAKLLLTSPSLPTCYFHQGQYRFKLQELMVTKNYVQIKLAYHLIYRYSPEQKNLTPCVCPQSGQFVVVYYVHCTEPICSIRHQLCSSRDFDIKQSQRLESVFNLVASLCVGLK